MVLASADMRGSRGLMPQRRRMMFASADRMGIGMVLAGADWIGIGMMLAQAIRDGMPVGDDAAMTRLLAQGLSLGKDRPPVRDRTGAHNRRASDAAFLLRRSRRVGLIFRPSACVHVECRGIAR
jgi:hypothetical protein